MSDLAVPDSDPDPGSVLTVIAQVLGLDDDLVVPEAQLADFGVDFEDAMELFVILEDTFGVEFRARMLISMRTVADIQAYVTIHV